LSRYLKAEVVDNQSLHPDYKLLTLSPLNPLNEPEAGQFYMIGLPHDPFLKRPFSHFRKRGDGIQIFFKLKGKGTKILGSLNRGIIVDILGPLGNPYPLPAKGSKALVVAGGIGIASLYSLIRAIPERPLVFYGARNKEELFFMDELKGSSEELFISTDDGSMGKKGLITELLDDFLRGSSHPVTIYACGPLKMLENVSTIAEKRGIDAYISVEERMACGIGACLGCVIMTTKGYQRVCKEGPVFRSGDIIW